MNASSASQQVSINNLNTTTASLLIETANLELFSASALSSISQLNASSASQQVSINALNVFTASQSTASIDSAITNLNQFTSSANGRLTNLELTSASLLVETQNLELFSASALVSISNLNANTASQQSQINSLINATASYADSASVALVDANQQSQINALIAVTASFLTSSADITSLNAFTASQLTINSGINTFTQSADSRLDNLENTTASLNNSVSNLNAFTSSQETYNTNNDTKWSDLGSKSGSWITESETGSFARYDVSNPWSADQTFTNITAVSASFTYVKTIFETASVIYSSGSNQFGDAADDIQTLYGSVRVMNELTASGLHYPTADGTVEQFLSTDGAGNLSFENVRTIYQNIRNREATTILKGTPLFASGSTGDNVDVYIADAGNPLRMPATLIAGDASLASGATGRAIIFGHIEGVDTNAYPAGTAVYVAVGGGWTATRPTGSSTPIQPLGVVTRQANNGMGIVMTETPYDLPNIQTGYVWVGNGSNQPIAISTGSFVKEEETGSLVTTASFNTYTSSNDTKVNSLISATASYANSASVAAVDAAQQAQINSLIAFTSSANLTSLNAFTASQLTINTGYNTYTSSTNSRLTNIEATTASINSSITQLNASSASQQVSINNLNTTTASLLIETQNLELFSASALVSINSLNSKTGSFATTGSNSFFGTNSFSGAVSFTGSAPSILSSSFSGSVITNLTDIYTNVPAVQQIVTLTSASYAALLSGSLVNPNTLYIVSGSGGGTIETGSFATTGSNTFVGNQIISGTFLQSGSNSLPGGPNGATVGTHIQNRVLISDAPGAITPRLYISGSDGAYTEMGRGFITQDTSKVPGLGAFIYTAGPTDTLSVNTVASITPDYSTDVELQMFASTSSVGLADWDNGSTFSYVPFMTLAPNNGDNPPVNFKRSVAVTGSLSVSGSTTITGSTDITGSLRATGELKFAVGGNKPFGTITASDTPYTLTNSLITPDSIIMLTLKTFSGGGGNPTLYIGSQTTGSAQIEFTNDSSAFTFNYMIINPA